MATLNGLPIFKMALPENEDEGIQFISIVDQPAIESNFVKFGTSIKMSKDELKYNLTGAFLIPDFPIYRFDKQRGEYYVIFTKEEIEKIATKFLKDKKTLAFNVMHEEGSHVDGVLIESWFVAANDKSKDMGFDFPEGTWAGTVHVEDINFWNEYIQTEKLKGFSIEGFLDLKMKKINNTMVKFEAQAKTADGIVLFTPADSFAVDAEVYIVDENGNQTPAADGEYVMEDGSTIVVAAGKVSEIKALEEAPADTTEVEQSVEVKQTLTPEDMQQIADLVNEINIELIDRIKVIEEKLAALDQAQMSIEEKFSKTPAAKSVTEKTDDVKKVTLEEKVIALRAIKENLKK